MALPGISNVSEFYLAHYIESVLTNDINKLRERWAEEVTAQLQADPSSEVSTLEALFKELRKPWQKLREAELGNTADPAERLRLQRELFCQPLMQALEWVDGSAFAAQRLMFEVSPANDGDLARA